MNEIDSSAMLVNNTQNKKITRLRMNIAKYMKLSWDTAPMVTYTIPVDATGLKEFRQSLKQDYADKGIKLTYNHIIMKVCADILMEMPEVNAAYNEETKESMRYEHANVGLAVATEGGLQVPNVKWVESLSLPELAERAEDAVARTLSGKITLDDITGGTFTVTSLGPFGVTGFTPIINQPELAILGVCDMVETPVVRNGEITVRSMMNLCLTADHRMLDGAVAARFLGRIRDKLEALPSTEWEI